MVKIVITFESYRNLKFLFIFILYLISRGAIEAIGFVNDFKNVLKIKL